MPHGPSSHSHARRSIPYLVILVVGAIVGSVWFLNSPSVYTGEYRLSIGQANISTAQVPGYTAAQADLASSYARLLQDTGNERKVDAESGVAPFSISASPIPSSSIIRVEATASSASVAESAARKAASRLKAKIDGANGNVQTVAKAFRAAYVDYIDAKTAAEAATKKANQLLSTMGPTNAQYKAAQQAAESSLSNEALLNLKQLSQGSAYQTAFGNAKNASVTMLGPSGPATSDRTAVLQRTVGVPLILAIAAALIFAYFRRGRMKGPAGSRPASSE